MSGRFWVWVFSEIDGLRWVLEHGRMAFASTAISRVRRMSKRDQAILYVSRGAFHNPIRDAARLGGVVKLTSDPGPADPIVIGGRQFEWFADFDTELVLPERQGPRVKPLVTELEFVLRPEVWGQYFRNSPIGIGEADFDRLSGAVHRWSDRHFSD